MKAIIITALFCVCTVLTNAQSDTTKTKQVDSTKTKQVDSIPKSKILYLAMPLEQWQGLLKILATADEKPSIVNAWMQLITNNVQEMKIDSIGNKKEVANKKK